MKPLVVGLAGGVGSGKSTVAALFRKWGARVVDADVLGHRLLDAPRVRARLVRLFGPGLLRGRRIDRRALAVEAFRSRRSVERLNRTVHPAILRAIRSEIRRARSLVVLDAALLYETGADALCDRVVYVDVPRAERARRVRSRGWAPGELARRERFQRPPAYKRKRADYVIDNAKSRARTTSHAREIFDELRKLVRQPTP
ncbi:MAG TPA: dephospho-CoA kinase [Planctomycetota bacterium]